MARKLYKKIETIDSKITEAVKNPALSVNYRIVDESVQAELRLQSQWDIAIKIDHIKYPSDLSKSWPLLDPWSAMGKIVSDLNRLSKIASAHPGITVPASSKSKTGIAARAAANREFRIKTGNEFLSAYETAGKAIPAIRKKIADLQAHQKHLIKQMRESNSRYLAGRKAEISAEKQADIDAIKSGEFWRASKRALTGYFHPPFDKNYLADVSEKWRAALFLECESISFKTYSGNWGHKLGGTGHAYLCGIDDNGDEWGHKCRVTPGRDQHGNADLDASVEEAMADLFEISASNLSRCERQGDLLFCQTVIPTENKIICSRCGNPRNVRPADYYYPGAMECVACGCIYTEKIIKPPTLSPHSGPWEIRESHAVESDGLLRNGRYFKSENPITVTHTSHHPVVLEPGEYRLYALKIENAD